MMYRGRVKNGVIVPEPGAPLHEGMTVQIEPVGETQDNAARDPNETQQLREGLLSFSGMIKDGPPDLARNHDHYLHGTPRR